MLEPTHNEKFKRFLNQASNPKYQLRQNITFTQNGKSILLRYATFRNGKLGAGVSQETYEKSPEIIDCILEEAKVRRGSKEVATRKLRGELLGFFGYSVCAAFCMVGLYYTSICFMGTPIPAWLGSMGPTLFPAAIVAGIFALFLSALLCIFNWRRWGLIVCLDIALFFVAALFFSAGVACGI